MLGDAQRWVLVTPRLYKNLCSPAHAKRTTKIFFEDAFPEQVGCSVCFHPTLLFTVSERGQQLTSLISLQHGDGRGRGQLHPWHCGHARITVPS